MHGWVHRILHDILACIDSGEQLCIFFGRTEAARRFLNDGCQDGFLCRKPLHGLLVSLGLTEIDVEDLSMLATAIGKWIYWCFLPIFTLMRLLKWFRTLHCRHHTLIDFFYLF